MNSVLPALYALQQIDSAVMQAQKQYQALDSGQAELAAAQSAKEIYDRAVRTYQETQRDLHDSELELKTVESKRKEYEGKLYGGKVSAFKELESFQEEIAALSRQRGRLDERILTLMDQIEVRKAEEQQAEERHRIAAAALAVKQADYKAKAKAIAAQVRTLLAKREEAVKPIPPAMLKRYDSYRAAKHGVAVARIEDDSCGACHTSLASGLITSVENTDNIETCDNCGRMLCGKGSK